jgi:hypothetical protein
MGLLGVSQRRKRLKLYRSVLCDRTSWLWAMEMEGAPETLSL